MKAITRRTTLTQAMSFALLIANGCIDRPMTVLERRDQARALTSEILVQFTKAVDASDRAVMAGSSETAATLVKEADDATQGVQTRAEALKQLLAGLEYSPEVQLLDEFSERFAQYRELDRRILEMVADSSNFGATRLAFGPSWQQADAFAEALRLALPLISDPGSRADGLVYQAVAAVREIQALQAPHIAEPADEPMTRMEQRMEKATRSARQALAALRDLQGSPAQDQLKAAGDILNLFEKTNGELLTLSRRNSNVHALALSLGQKRILVGTCDESLTAIQQALSKRGFTGTR